MEEIDVNMNLAQELLESIKKDDLKKFKEIVGKDRFLNLCFGRFPILSICYLYESNNILSIYEKTLKGITGYVFLDEDIEVYNLFKVKAKRSLRLYSDGIVSYMDMLAILGDGSRLNKETKALDETSILSLEKTFKLSNDKLVKNKKGRVYFPSKPLPKKTKIFASIVSSFLCVMIVLSSLLFVYLDKVPNGSQDKPYAVSSQSLFLEMADSESYINLIGDLMLSSNIENFNANINGNNNTIYINNFSGPLINNLNGSLKNINIIIDGGKLDVTSSTSFIAVINNGTIDNVNIVVKNSSINVLKVSDEASTDTTYIGGLVAANGGSIINSSVTFENVCISGYEHVNGYLGGISGKNLNSISNCVSYGEIKTDTVDVAGIVAENAGQIYKCYNKANISQTTSSKTWNPNVAGIVGYNTGNINSTINYGVIYAESLGIFSEDEENANLSVLGAGICAQNTGTIENSLNYGNINILAQDSSVISGSIVAYSSGSINKCGNENEMNIEVQNDNVGIIGGIVGRIVGTGLLLNSYSISSFDIICAENKECLGGACGMCSATIYQYYYYGYYQFIASIAYLKSNADMYGVCYVENMGLLPTDYFTNVVGFEDSNAIKETGVYFNEESIK